MEKFIQIFFSRKEKNLTISIIFVYTLQRQMKTILYLLSFVLVFSTTVNAQRIDRTALGEKVLKHLDSVGKMEGYLLRDIVSKLYRRDFNEVEITYAIYSWIAKNITYNTQEYHHPRTANSTSSMALMRRSTTSQGYAILFKDMCANAHIESVIVDGKAKPNPAAIDNARRLMKHYWNVVKIKGTEYYVDAAFGAGYFDSRVRNFEKEFTDAWCFADRRLFCLSHVPNDKKSPYVDVPINPTRYLQAPIVYGAALRDGIYFPEKTRGLLKGRQGDCKRMIFDLARPEEISRASVIADGKEITTDYYVVGNRMYVDVPFPKQGSYPLIISLNGKQAFGFNVEAKPSKKRR